MKVLVLGATGMLGHKLAQVLSDDFDVTATVRGTATDYRDHPVLGNVCLAGSIDAGNFDSVVRVVAATRPDAVVNCIGVVKQSTAGSDPMVCIPINALFPHQLARVCGAEGVRLIHFSTDCVFSGNKGDYAEDDPADPDDLYGRTKLLGEVSAPGCLTLRMSVVGRELSVRQGLLEWLIGNRNGTVTGYANAVYTGFSTLELSRIVRDILQQHTELSGVWHVSADKISKYDLLCRMNKELKLNVSIGRDESFRCDRSLSSDRFRRATGYTPPSWSDMIAELARDDVYCDR